MKYGPDQGWTVNAYPAGVGGDQWHLVATVSPPTDIVLPGNVGYRVGAGGHTDFEACVDASRNVPAVEFDFAGGPIGVRLADTPYDDNVSGIDERDPTWSLECVTH
jgi:hypothetical protein